VGRSRNNPVKSDCASARSAGPLLLAGENIIRPAQDRSQTYGGALVLNMVTRLDRSGFGETAHAGDSLSTLSRRLTHFLFSRGVDHH
jgi:hypothetical protein